MARVAVSISADTSRFIARKAAESLGEIGAASVETNGHGGFPAAALNVKACPLLNGAAANRRQPFAFSASEGCLVSDRRVGRGASAPCPPKWFCARKAKSVGTRSLSSGAHSRDPLASPTLHRRSGADQASSPDGSAPSPRSPVPRSSAPRSVSSHSRHSTSSRSAPPWLNSSTALPPGASPG